MTTTGALGGRWRATITEWGGIEPWRDEPALQWHVAADDRWHSPEHEAAVRQTRPGGAPVTETRVRIPNGDAVQRVYSVPDHGGLTVIEVENESPLPIAVAFTHGRLLSARPGSAAIEGIVLPEGSVVFPVGHHSTLTVALSHDGRGAGVLPTNLPTATGVARGWTAMSDRASRLVLPDESIADRVVAERCELALAGPVHPDDDAVSFLLGAAQLVRMGEQPEPWLPDVASAAEHAARAGADDWALPLALQAADSVFVAAGDRRASRDLAAVRRRVANVATVLPESAPTAPARYLTWVEARLAVPVDGGAALLPAGLPPSWTGANFEVYGLPTGGANSVSFAVRWHGERPAVLWEQTGEPLLLSAPEVAPAWKSADSKGEALWPAPAGVAPVVDGFAADAGDGGSFS